MFLDLSHLENTPWLKELRLLKLDPIILVQQLMFLLEEQPYKLAIEVLIITFSQNLNLLRLEPLMKSVSKELSLELPENSLAELLQEHQEP